MGNFQFEIFRVCSRAGHEYYHIFPKQKLGDFPEQVNRFRIIEKKEGYIVLDLSDCKVTLFKCGRILIEDLPENSDFRAKEIVEAIMG